MIKRESYTFTGFENLPDQSWEFYFKNSVLNNTYEVLYNSETSELMMCNTEIESDIYNTFYSHLFQNAKVLSIGYGIGYMNSKIREFNASLTIIENNSDVINLETDNISDFTMITNDAYTCDYPNLFLTEKFDLILFDPSAGGNNNKTFPKEALKNLLETNGKLIAWTSTGCVIL